MMRKSIGWLALYGCLIVVGYASIDRSRWSPQSAQAKPAPSDAAQTWNTTQACQAVINQVLMVQRITADEVRSANSKCFPALDECVTQEYQIDTSNCPADFRLAVLHFTAAQDLARIHAHMDKTGQTEAALAACVELMIPRFASAPKPAFDAQVNLADGPKQDMAKIESAGWDLVQVAMKYGVK